MRKKIIAGNWKMHKTYGEALMLGNEVAEAVAKDNHPSLLTILAPAFPFITAVARSIDGTEAIEVAAQNCHWENSGAYTGEVSVPMIISAGAHYVIIGHSERRKLAGETDEILRKKLQAALGSGLKPIFCIGENAEQRKTGEHFLTVFEQLRNTIFHFDELLVRNSILAYEPVWAIGTGVNATPAQAQEMHAFIRKSLAEKFGKPMAESIPILYGGSCNALNAAEIFEGADIDGGLIGGASLRVDEFAKIRRALLGRLKNVRM